MADPQNVEVMQDPKGPPPANANGVEAEHQGDDDAPDPKLLKSEIDKLKKQLGTVLNEKKRETEAKRALSEKLKGWADLEEETGLNVEQAREMAKARDAADMANAKDKGEIDKLLENQAKKFQKDIEKHVAEAKNLTDQITLRQAKIDALTIDRELMDELAKIVEPALLRGAYAIHRPKAKALEDSEAPHGVRVVMVVGDDEMKVADYFKAWAEADPEAQAYLIGNKSSGGGAPAGGKAGGIPRMKRSQMTAKQKADFMTAHGIDRYNQLPL
jgi:hypothetical protein